MTYPHARRSHAVQALALAIVSSLALPCNADQQAVLKIGRASCRERVYVLV